MHYRYHVKTAKKFQKPGSRRTFSLVREVILKLESVKNKCRNQTARVHTNCAALKIKVLLATFQTIFKQL